MIDVSYPLLCYHVKEVLGSYLMRLNSRMFRRDIISFVGRLVTPVIIVI